MAHKKKAHAKEKAMKGHEEMPSHAHKGKEKHKDMKHAKGHARGK